MNKNFFLFVGSLIHQHILNSLNEHRINYGGIATISAVVLVNTEYGEENSVLESVKTIKEVQEAHAIWGVYDLLVKIKTDSMERLKEIIQTSLKRLVGISSVLTLMIVESPITA